MFGLGTTELLVIGGILVFIFGAKKLPEIGKGLGGAIREFKKIGISPKENEKVDNIAGGAKGSDKNNPTIIEAKFKEKVVEQIPGAKQALNLKKKAEAVKDVIDS